MKTESKVPEGCKAGPRVHGASPPELASGASDEDVVAGGVDHPVVPLPGIVVVPRHLYIKTVDKEYFQIVPLDKGQRKEYWDFNIILISMFCNDCFNNSFMINTNKRRLFNKNTNLYEAFVETEVVSDGVLPTLLVVLVIWELHRDVLVDPCNQRVQEQLLIELLFHGISTDSFWETPC